MGEQSAKSLRGDKMEDVIFSGRDARKPTGSAEVRLRLSGGHRRAPRCRQRKRRAECYGEAGGHYRPTATPTGTETAIGNGHVADLMAATRDVEITRRLYRSGESEYLIHGEICRLRTSTTSSWTRASAPRPTRSSSRGRSV